MASEKLLIDLQNIDMNEVDTSDCTDVEDILSAVITYLSDQPIVDAVPVVHAYWQRYKEDSSEINFRCSHCKGYHFHNGAMRKKYKHCPNCGAKMDQEADHES